MDESNLTFLLSNIGTNFSLPRQSVQVSPAEELIYLIGSLEKFTLSEEEEIYIRKILKNINFRLKGDKLEIQEELFFILEKSLPERQGKSSRDLLWDLIKSFRLKFTGSEDLSLENMESYFKAVKKDS